MNQSKLSNTIWYGVVLVTGIAMAIHEVHHGKAGFVYLAAGIDGLGGIRLIQTIRS